MGTPSADELWVWALMGAVLLVALELLFLDRRRRAFMAAAQPISRTTPVNVPVARDATPAADKAQVAAPPRKRRRSHHAVQHILDTMTPPPASITDDPESPTATVTEQRPPNASPVLAPVSDAPPPAATPPGQVAVSPTVHELPTDAIAASRAADADVGIVYVDLEGRFTFATQVARDLLEWQSGELMLADILAQGGGAHSAALLKLVAQQEVLDQPVQVLVKGQPQQFEISALALRDRDDKMWGAALFLRRSART